MNATSTATPPNLLDRLLLSLAIDPRSYRALIKAYVAMDFRNQQFGKSTNTGAKALISPLFWVLGQNLIIGLCAAVVLFARVDIYFFTLVGLALSMITVAAAVVVEFNEIVIDPQDLAIIGHQPLPARTYAAARVTNLLGYVLVMSCSLALFPAIIGAAMRDAPWWQGPGYFAAAIVGDFTIAALVILLYLTIGGGRPAPDAQEVLAWLQIGLILILFYGGQLLIRDGQQSIQWIAYDLPTWVASLPTAWLAMGIGLTYPHPLWWILPVGAMLMVATWVLVLNQLSTAYAQLQPGRPAWAPTTSPPLPLPGTLAPTWMRALTLPGEERTAFWLTWTMLRRDTNLRMRCWPSLSIVMALLFAGAFSGRLRDPFTSPSAESVMTLGAVYMLGASLPAFFHNLRFSQQHDVAWLLAISPIANRGLFARGQLKAVAVQFMVPAVVVMLLLFAYLWRDAGHALIHVALAWCAMWGMAWGCAAIQLRRNPFAQPLARGEAFGPIAPLAAVTSGVAIMLGTLHALSIQRTDLFATFVASVVIGSVLIGFLAKRSLTQRTSNAEFIAAQVARGTA